MDKYTQQKYKYRNKHKWHTINKGMQTVAHSYDNKNCVILHVYEYVDILMLT